MLPTSMQQEVQHSGMATAGALMMVLGPVLCVTFGWHNNSESGSYTSLFYMGGALLGNAFNIVVSYYFVQNMKGVMTMGSMIFWVDLMMLLFLAPIAVMTEARDMGNWFASCSF